MKVLKAIIKRSVRKFPLKVGVMRAKTRYGAKRFFIITIIIIIMHFWHVSAYATFIHAGAQQRFC